MATAGLGLGGARTVTVKVRTLIGVAIAIAVIGSIVYWLHWATSMTPLVADSEDDAPIALGIRVHTNDPGDTGPPTYLWHRGGRYVVALWFTNTARVPVTITGADHTGASWVGTFSGPTLGTTDEHQPGSYTPFHPVRIPAGGMRAVTFVFHANPKACGDNALGSSTWTNGVTVHFTTMGVFSDSETAALNQPFVLQAPTRAACAA